MKKIITLSLICIFNTIINNAQCTSNATMFGNNATISSYNVTGTVSVVLNTSTTITLNLGSDFATASGPDVRAFLVDRGTLTNAQLRMTSNFLSRPRIEMGLINANGAASFTKTIPAGMNISNFNTVYLYCVTFNQFWDFGSFTAFTNSNCSSLSNEDFSSNNFKIYPNPSKGRISIDFNQATEIKSLQIYSALGKKVFVSNDTITANAAIDISVLTTGMYILELVDKENNVFFKKIFVN